MEPYDGAISAADRVCRSGNASAAPGSPFPVSNRQSQGSGAPRPPRPARPSPTAERSGQMSHASAPGQTCPLRGQLRRGLALPSRTCNQGLSILGCWWGGAEGHAFAWGRQRMANLHFQISANLQGPGLTALPTTHFGAHQRVSNSLKSEEKMYYNSNWIVFVSIPTVIIYTFQCFY